MSGDRWRWTRWTGWGTLLAIICLLGPPLYVIVKCSEFANDNSRRLGIFLEIASFAFVTPEFLGTDRLRSLAEIVRGPLVSVRKYQEALGKEWDVTVDDLLLGLVTLIFLGGLTVACFATYQLWPFWLLALPVALVLGLFGLFSSLKTLFITSAYLAAAGLNRFLSTLADRERLRLWIFWLGADCFLVSKLLVLCEAHK